MCKRLLFRSVPARREGVIRVAMRARELVCVRVFVCIHARVRAWCMCVHAHVHLFVFFICSCEVFLLFYLLIYFFFFFSHKQGIMLKFNPLPQNLAGKNVVLIDDSIVRGNTLVSMQ